MKENLFDPLSINNLNITSISCKEEILKEKYLKLINKVNLDGKFQIIIFLFLSLTGFVSALFITSLPLQKDLPKLYCLNKFQLVLDFNSTVQLEIELDEQEQKQQEIKTLKDYKINPNNYLMIEDLKCVKNFCRNKLNNPDPDLLLLDNRSLINIATELGIICELDEFFQKLTQIVFLGKIFGIIIYSYISDKYGRYICLKIQINILLISYTGFLLFKSIIIYYFLGFLVSSCLNIYNLVIVISTEAMNFKLYSLLNGVVGFCFSLNGLINLTVLYYLKNWNLLIYLNLLTTVIVFFISKYYIRETPLYLLDQKRYIELNKVLEHTIYINFNQNFNSQINYLKEIQSLSNFKKNEENFFTKNNFDISWVIEFYTSIFKSSSNIENFLRLVFLFITMNFIFYGQILNMEKMSGYLYSNLFVIYLADLVAGILSGYVLQYYKRKIIIVKTFGLCAIIFFILNLIEIYFKDSLELVKYILIFINSFIISVNYATVYLYSAEIFDTKIKSTLFSFLNIIVNISMIISPYILNKFKSSYLIFSLCSAFAFLNGLILKEDI